MPPGNGYSHAVAAAGRIVVISGQLPLDADGELVGPGDASAQMRKVFSNLRAALTAASTTMDQVIKLTAFLTDLADLPAFRSARDEHISASQPPASSLVQVSALVHPEARVEIEALAVTPLA
jgi:reactive intermediate/imine deaminase